MIQLLNFTSPWPQHRLVELFEIRGGVPAPQSEDAFDDEGIPFLRMRDVGREHFTRDLKNIDSTISKKYAEERNLDCVPTGSIIMPRSGSVGLNHRAVLGRPAVIVSHLFALVPSIKIESAYAYHLFCQMDMRKLTKKTTGLDSINFSDVREIAIPLPPLGEQRRIAAILDQADALRRKRREALRKVEDLYQSQFENVFGDPRRNEMGWPTVPFGDLLTDIESGWSPTCLDRPAKENEWGVLKLGAVTYGRFDESAQKALPEGTTPRPRTEVQVGDLLFTRKNTYELVAACALVRETRPRLLLPDLIFRLCLADPILSHPEYVHALLSHPAKRAEIQSLASGAAGSMPNISKARLRTVPICLPPPELQARFAEAVEELELTRSQAVAHLAHLDTLFASLQHCAFGGGL